MGVTNYLTVDGQIRSEHRAGDTHTRDYVLDALGSVVEVFQGTGVVADASYKPYGAMVNGSWNMTSYKFRWLGGWGYRYTGLDWVTAYVRARHYSYNDGAWTSVDPLWPRQPAYRYVDGKVTASVDPSGKDLATMVLGALKFGSDHIACGETDDNGKLKSQVLVSVDRRCPSGTQGAEGQTTQPRPNPYKTFGGNPLQPNYWHCMEKGVATHCKDIPWDPQRLLVAMRCIAYAESNDGQSINKDSDGKLVAPYGLFQIGRRGKNCDEKYPNWKTDNCDNAKCASMLLCSCLRRSATEGIGACGNKGNLKGGPADYLLFQVLDYNGTRKFCDCMAGYGATVHEISIKQK